ncbi:MAG: NUDIX domain-containing protein, partial [Candidatus Hodarchaeota archaeon]
IPSGGMEKDEQPETAAQRELREEIGYQADHFQLLSIMHSNKSIMEDRGYIFLAQGLTPSKAVPDETEEFEVISMSLEKALNMVKNYEITDCVSIIGLLLAHSNSEPKL